jgi:hypothetical protein
VHGALLEWFMHWRAGTSMSVGTSCWTWRKHGLLQICMVSVLFLKFDSPDASQCINKVYHTHVRTMLEMLGC